MEVSPHNSLARRAAGGIWNEDSLPIMDWEVANQRKVLPTSMQERIGSSVSVLRVSKDIDRKQHVKHADILPLYEAFDVASWSHSREILEERGKRWEFVLIVDESRASPWPLMIVMGEDSLGSINLVSMHRRNSRWMTKLQNDELMFEKREK